MPRQLSTLLAIVTVTALTTAAAPRVFGQTYTADPAHTSVVFRIQHAGLALVYGRFNDVRADITLDADDPAKASFAVTIDAASIDTGVEQRDNHLRSADFFDVEKYPRITFASTSVKPTDSGWEVTGDLNMHGVTKPITLNVLKSGQGEFPEGTQRAAFSTEFTVKRSDFGIGFPKFADALGDEVDLFVSIEALEQKPAE